MDRRTGIAMLTVLAALPGMAAAGGNVAEAFAAALSAHDLKAFAALFAEDYAQHQTSAAAPKPPPGLSAKQNTVNYFAARLTALPDLKVVADPVVVAGDMVAANFTYSGTHRATYFGIAPTGRRVVFNSCDILMVRNGLIAAHWGAADVAGLLAQLHA
ncbi:MAG: ester cyclase [Alphaproteobacteria bacterium]|nr:ester cyclase [Alphaproteobacteria bacterium]